MFQAQREPSNDLYLGCVRFLNHEAELLDSYRFSEWLDLVSEDIEYEVPVRTDRERSAEQFSDSGFHFKEDYRSLETRVERLNSEFVWSHDPPMRTRRFVSNVRVTDWTEDTVTTKNNLLLFRSQGNRSSYDLVSGERHDTIDTDTSELTERSVLLDHTVLEDHLDLFL